MRALSVLIVLPLMLTRFSVQEIAAWYLLVTLIGLQQLADMGFASTFARVFAYAMGGATSLKDFRTLELAGDGSPNWDVVERIWATMRVVYTRLTLVFVLVFAVLGSWALKRPFSLLTDSAAGWTSWGVVIVTFTIVLRGNAFGAYLQGVNEIALLRRWEALTSGAAMVTSAIVLLLGGHLLAVVIANQSWTVLNTLRDWRLCRVVEGGRYRLFKRRAVDPEIFDAVWPSAVRSGIGVAFSRGVIFTSGLVYAQVADAAMLAAYLVAFRVIQMIMDFANAPFYSKLPVLSRLRSEGRADDQVRLAARGMRLTYWTYVAGIVGAGLFVEPLLAAIHSHAGWVSPGLWATMGLAFFVERFGAVHLQLYSTTNHIIWHVANGISGTIYLVVSLALLHSMGVFAFPIGILVGYLCFYSWYAPWHVYKTFQMNFWRYQRNTVLIPGSLLLIYCVAIFLQR